MIMTDKKQADTQRYVITVIGILSLTSSKVILFYAGISALEKKSPAYISTAHIFVLLISHGTTFHFMALCSVLYVLIVD
jgi:hypothetical protein